METDFYRWGKWGWGAVKQERGRKGSNLQSGGSPLHRLSRGPPSTALPLPAASHGQMLPGRPPAPTPQPDQQMPGAHSRSPAWSKEPVLPGPRNHPSLCRARSWHLGPAPSSQVPRLQARMALDSSVTHALPVCGGSLGALPSEHIPALGPAHHVHSMTRHHFCLGDCNGSPGLPAPVPAHFILSLAQRLE